MLEFTRDALSNEMGVTVPDVPGRTFGNLIDSDSVPDPEIDESSVQALTFFLERLAPPTRHSTDPVAEAAGETVFNNIGCSSCHVADFVSPNGAIPYTDLLLHQVAPNGSPGIAAGVASPLEFRTPPLWGLSLSAPYMHDGRAFTIEEAIERHDGEAASSRAEFDSLTPDDRDRLLAFLNSL